jgi:hypothetical protein
MDVRNVGRTALDTWLRISRAPFDAASRLLPNGTEGPRTPAILVLDRVDATIRDTVGTLLRDDQLREDAGRRRIAADERERALELRIEAEAKKREADARLAQRHESVERQRADAEQRAEQQKRQAEREKTEREQRAKQAAAKQARAVEKAEQQKLAAAETKAKKRRLRVLDTEAGALDTEVEALTATDEAQRLRKAASAAKAARKGTR